MNKKIVALMAISLGFVVGYITRREQVKWVWVKVPFGGTIQVADEKGGWNGGCPKDFVLTANVVNNGPGCVKYELVWAKFNTETGEEVIDMRGPDPQGKTKP